MESSVDVAALLFAEGYNCSQALLAAHAEELGISEDAAYKMGSVFGAGIGRAGEVCGAVTGALMVIGLKCGCVDPADKPRKEHTYGLARRFLEDFSRREGSILCRDLLGRRIDQPEALEEARRQGLFEAICPRVVMTAAEIVREIIDREPPA